MQIESELRRVHYLQAMGITVLASRRPMPGAAPTTKLLLREPLRTNTTESTGREQGQPSVQTEGTAHSPTLDFEGLRGTLSTESTSTESTARSTDSTASLPSDQNARAAATDERSVSFRQDSGSSSAQTSEPIASAFSIAAFVGAGRLWLELLPERLLQREQQALIYSMALALKHPVPEAVEVIARQFDWPMHRNQQLDSGAQEAAQALTGFVSRQYEESRCTSLLCLGAATEERLLPLALPMPMKTLPSTREMLSNPFLKREAWVVLRD
ncbi:MAG: hypothetical protein AAF991_12855 [Pseudomonadota bacterium]